MCSLTNDQKQLLFDYCLGLTSKTESAKAEVLLSAIEEACKFRSRLKALLTPLGALERALERKVCPECLVEKTVCACCAKRKLGAATA